MSIDAMKQALITLEWNLPVLEDYGDHEQLNRQHKAITALRAAIEQAQEPVAWMNPSWIDSDTRGWASDSFESIQIEGWIPLYTAPRQWQGLTDQEIWSDGSTIDLSEDGIRNFARAIEAKLKEKNT